VPANSLSARPQTGRTYHPSGPPPAALEQQPYSLTRPANPGSHPGSQPSMPASPAPPYADGGALGNYGGRIPVSPQLQAPSGGYGGGHAGGFSGGYGDGQSGDYGGGFSGGMGGGFDGGYGGGGYGGGSYGGGGGFGGLMGGGFDGGYGGGGYGGGGYGGGGYGGGGGVGGGYEGKRPGAVHADRMGEMARGEALWRGPPPGGEVLQYLPGVGYGVET
jgi:hypothetical protein